LSQRVMNTLSSMVPEMEIYSIDEAFLDVSFVNAQALTDFAVQIRDTVYRHTGIPVSVGVAKTKTLAKVANHLAKSGMGTDGVLNLAGCAHQDDLLQQVPVEAIWGVGEKYARFFNKTGIQTALDLKQADPNRIREKLGVVGQRLVLELAETVCYTLNQNPDTKKEICTSRSFGHPVESYDELEMATTSYAAKVAKKLRNEHALAQTLLVFVMTNKFSNDPQYVNYKIVRLPAATDDTRELIHFTVIALKALYKEGYKYKKSGIIVSEVIPKSGVQTSLWEAGKKPENIKLTEVIDRINAKAGLDKVKFAIQGTDESWGMRQHNLSPHYTTRWEDLLIVDLDRFGKPDE